LIDDQPILNFVSKVYEVADVSRIFGVTGLFLEPATVRDIL